MAVNWAKSGGRAYDVWDGIDGRKGDKYKGWGDCTLHFLCCDAVLCCGGHNNHVTEIFNLLYRRLYEHLLMYHAENVIFI